MKHFFIMGKFPLVCNAQQYDNGFTVDRFPPVLCFGGVTRASFTIAHFQGFLLRMLIIYHADIFTTSIHLGLTPISHRELWLSVDLQNFPFVTFWFKFLTDSHADLSLHSLTLSVLSPETVCVVEKDLENINYIFVTILQSHSGGKIECVCHQIICRTHLDSFYWT